MDQAKKQSDKSGGKKLILTVALLAVAVIAFLIINPITGNPLSKLLVAHTAKAYIATHYSAFDLRLERVVYNFKDGCYHADFATQENVDLCFSVAANGWGKFLSDNYESRVTSGWNTAARLDKEYRALADTVLRADTFPYICEIGFGELLFDDFSSTASSAVHLNMADLELGKAYDVPALAKNYGKLTVYIDRETVTVEEAANVLLDLKHRMDDFGVSFHYIDFVLQYPRPETEKMRPDGTVTVLDFLYEDIYEEGMEDRVQTAYAAALSYYNEQDAGKADAST